MTLTFAENWLLFGLSNVEFRIKPFQHWTSFKMSVAASF